MNLNEEIKKLKEKKEVAILAHYYVEGAVQDIADYVGDSYYLSKMATEVPQKNILFCGVKFMGESAKILNPEKHVIMVDEQADCPMAHMIDAKTIDNIRAKYDDIAVVCYINSSAEIKAHSDVCVTSSNAFKIVSKLPQKNILFIPDNHLGTYLSTKMPNKHFVFHHGYCPVHQDIRMEDVKRAKQAHPEAEVLAHPECSIDVLSLAHYIGSTSEIIDYATKSGGESFIIATEDGVLHKLRSENANKKFYLVNEKQQCLGMKMNTLEKVYDVLNSMENEMLLNEELRQKAQAPLTKMHELAE
ncbi:quinolinate synthase A [Anaerotignum neopropionicum]|uniref:Quinolinate synthase n=1 Tax=Anaerotignum neopropionicum TaxID=36847 RepID=A0A136WE78_9FIRM|nr:quinolinate synthase NadA [Anaerotignum neopropionicum]KXL52781.1 quinolinate synthase A [Anaerotignum neopropionicum]